MKKLKINTSSKSYNIYISKGLISNCLQYIKEIATTDKLFIITDDIVAKLYLNKLIDILKNDFLVNYAIIPNGEENKNINSVIKLYQQMQNANISRNDLVIALGGGVVGDVAGFTASTYLRGVKYIQIPTTLLSQVDSSIGGKTGVDMPNGKNLIGTFYQPELVIIDIDLLSSLPEEHISSGMAEVIKSAFIADEKLIDLLDKSTDFNKDVEDFITKSLNVKKKIVEDDELEKGQRMLLNFGHTLGHAIEKYYNYKNITHGQAIAYGMCKITDKAEIHHKLVNLLLKYNLKTEVNIPNLTYLAKNDKKVIGENIYIVKVDELCKGKIVNLSFKEFCSKYE